MPKNTSPRQQHVDRVDPGEKLDPKPIEIPIGAEKPKSLAQEVQEQIAIQMAKKDVGVNRLTPQQHYDELMDLDPDDPDPPWTSQYEVQELVDPGYEPEQAPEGAPPPEGEPQSEDPPEVDPSPDEEAA